MIVRPCPDSLDCIPDQPLDNFSSEGDDTLDFISTQYGYINPRDRLWDATLCNVTFVSSISQADADQKATASALNCQPCPTCTFSNTAQTVCVPCPDGTSQSCYTVAAGLFSGFLNQEAADSAAYNFGLLQVRRDVFCLSSVFSCGCLGSAYSSDITTALPSIWTFDGGSLPPGMVFNSVPGFSTSASITGVPVVPGQFAFRIRATSQDGTYSLRTYVIYVITITTGSLPSFTVGVPYSFQMQATGGSGNYAWKITSGALPAGLTMSVSGLISGTPASAGTNPLVFDVVDTICVAADQSFFPPKVDLITKSTTTIATILGYPEYIASTPPKKYKRLAWSGSCKQTMVTAGTHQNCGGARYDWSGEGVIDSKGNQLSNYKKDFFAECPKVGPWPFITSVPNFGLITFVGYCWNPDPISCQSCDSNDANWAFVLNLADNRIDDSAQSGFNNLLIDTSLRVITSTSLDDSATGTQQVVAIGPVTNFPKTTLNGLIDNWTIVTTVNTCKSQLSDEYTDAEALQNAQVIVSNGHTAENLPRTTGFVSRFTNVIFDLSCTSLIIGKNYIVTATFRDRNYVLSQKTYSFQATKTTNVITDIVPTPAAGGTMSIVSATIAFSP